MQKIKLTEIFYNEYYKLSYPLNSDLIRSVEKCGVIDPVVLYEKEGQYRIFTGHNRFKAALETGKELIPYKLVDLPQYDSILHEAVTRIFNKRISFSGRLKVIHHPDFSPENNLEMHLNAGKSVNDRVLCERILNLPESIILFFDLKDAPYKIAEQIVEYDKELITVLSDFVKRPHLQLSSFREIISLINDLIRLNHSESILEMIRSDLPADEIILMMRSLRFPEYISYQKKIDDISDECRKSGYNVVFPKFGEGKTAELKFLVNRKDRGKSALKSILNFDEKIVEEINQLL